MKGGFQMVCLAFVLLRSSQLEVDKMGSETQFISDHSYKIFESTKFPKYQNHTISFWYQHLKISSPNDINLLTFRYDEKPSEFHFVPDCPVSQKLLKEMPFLLNNTSIKNNQNCFIERIFLKNNKKNDLLKIDLKFVENSTKVVFKFINFDENTNQIEIPIKQLWQNDLIFFGVSFDYNSKSADLLIKYFSPSPVEIKKSVDFSFKGKNPPSVLSIYSENTKNLRKSMLFGQIFRLNIVYESLKMTDLLSYAKITSEIIFENFIFNPFVLNDSLSSNDFSSQSENKIDLKNRFKKSVFPESPTFQFSFKLTQEYTGEIIIAKWDFIEINLSFQFTFEKSTLKPNYEHIFCIKKVKNGFEAKKHCQKMLIEREDSVDFFVSFLVDSRTNLSISLFMEDEIVQLCKNEQVEQLDLNTSIFQIQNDVLQYLDFLKILLFSSINFNLLSDNYFEMQDKGCRVALGETSEASEKCIMCQDQLLDVLLHECVEICQPNFQVVGSFCVPCSQIDCFKKFSSQYDIIPLKNNHVILKFHQDISHVDFTSNEHFVGFIKSQKMAPALLSISKINSTFVDLTIKSNKTIFNSSLQFDLQNSKKPRKQELIGQQVIFPIIQETESSMFASLRIASVLFGIIFYSNLVVGIFLFVCSFRHNLNHFACKKICNNVQILQLQIFILFIGFKLPSNLQVFLSDSFSNCLIIPKLVTFVFALSDQKTHWRPFLNVSQRFEFFVEFRTILYFGLICLFSYILTKSLVLLFPQTKSTIRSGILKVFEFNGLLILISILNPFVFFITGYNIRLFIKTHNYKLIAAEIIYSSICLVLLSALLLSFFCKNLFTSISNLKYKLSYLFIGYKNQPLSNFFEVYKICVIAIFSISVSILCDKPIDQIFVMIMLFSSVIFYAILSFPYQSKIDFISEIAFYALMVGILSTIYICYQYWFTFYIENDMRIGGIIAWIIVFYHIGIFLRDVIVLTRFLLIMKSSDLILSAQIEKSKTENLYGNSKDVEDSNLVIPGSTGNTQTFGTLGQLASKNGSGFYNNSLKRFEKNDDNEIRRHSENLETGENLECVDEHCEIV